MQDALAPHTSWFVQSEQAGNRKEFCYNLIANRLVTWTVRETKPNLLKPKEYCNLIYVRQAFGKPIDITEKRSYVYSFKSFVIRDDKGASAGFYSHLPNHSITFFYPSVDGHDRVQRKYDLDQLFCEQMMEDLKNVSEHMYNEPGGLDYLKDMLTRFREIVKDDTLCQDLMRIDRWIEEEL